MSTGGARRDLVVFGTHPFQPGVPLGDWHLARALARRHRVLWVDPAASPLAPRRGVASDAMFARRPRAVADGLVVGAPMTPSGRPLPRLAGVVERLVTAQVNRWTRLLGMTDVDAISFAPRLGALRGLRRHRLAAWLKDRDWAAVGTQEPEWLRQRAIDLVRHADVVSGVSAALVEDCRALGVRAMHIPNGCDVDAFGAATVEPIRMRQLPHPRAVFAGAWNERVDVDLVRGVAERLPTFSFVVVGAVSAPVPDLANVHVVGPVAYTDLPAYLQAADVGIVPYRKSTFNSASCPLKIYEYLAAGRPVVASAVDMGDLPTFLARRCDEVESFAAALHALAGGDLDRACRAVAAQHSWDARAATLLGVLDAVRLGAREDR